MLEHDYLAQVALTGEMNICQVLRSAHNDRACTPEEAANRKVQVRWLIKERRSHVVEHCTQLTRLKMRLQYRGGWGEGRHTRHNDKAPHQEWIWSTVAKGSEYVAIDTLCPVTVSEVDVMETWRISGHGTLVVIDEPDRWWELARWEVPEGSWAFPRHRVVGEQFSSTSIQLSEVHRAQRAWQATLQVQAQAVLPVAATDQRPVFVLRLLTGT